MDVAVFYYLERGAIDKSERMFYNNYILLRGRSCMNIYEHCPEIAGERFCLRFVREADCDDLLRVYSDPAAVPLFNIDNCGGDDFNYDYSG